MENGAAGASSPVAGQRRLRLATSVTSSPGWMGFARGRRPPLTRRARGLWSARTRWGSRPREAA